MPVLVKSVETNTNPVLKQGCVYKIIKGYQVGRVFTVCHDDIIQYLSETSNSTGYSHREVLSMSGASYVEINLKEV